MPRQSSHGRAPQLVQDGESPVALPIPRHPIALARRFYQLTTAVTAEVQERERTGLRHLEFGVIVRVHDTPGLDQNSLAEWLALDRTTISAMVFRLEQQGLLERAVNGTDRRARVLRLTKKGRALHDRVRPLAQAAQERILTVLTPADRRSLIEMLARVIEGNYSYVRPGAGRRRPVRTRATATP
jgi:DNA-binding MarR family transcriptional regulator